MDSDIEMDMESDNDGEYDDDYDYYNTGEWKLVPDLEGHFPLTTIGHRFNCGQIRGTSVSVRKYTHTYVGLLVWLFTFLEGGPQDQGICIQHLTFALGSMTKPHAPHSISALLR